MTEHVSLKLSEIRRDGGTQTRSKLDPATLDDYVDLLHQHRQSGAWPFRDPVTVYYDGTDYWLADGFHRLAACERHGRFTVLADVTPGTRRDAILHAAGANASHGLRRSQETKRNAVLMLLKDDEWCQWSDREIARRCHVSHPTVAAIRAELAQVTGKFTSERTYTDKHGNTTTMETANIGQQAPPAPEPDRTDQYQDKTYRRVAGVNANGHQEARWVPVESAPAVPAVTLHGDAITLHGDNGQTITRTLQPIDPPPPGAPPLSTITQIEYFARWGAKSPESIYQELADPNCSGYAMQMDWMAKQTGLSPAVIQEVAAHLSRRPRPQATKEEIGVAIGYLMGQLAQGLDPSAAVETQRAALMDLARSHKQSKHWAALDLDNRLDNKPWAIGDLLAVVQMRLDALPKPAPSHTPTSSNAPDAVLDAITVLRKRGYEIEHAGHADNPGAKHDDLRVWRVMGLGLRSKNQLWDMVNLNHYPEQPADIPVATPVHEEAEALATMRRCKGELIALAATLDAVHITTIAKLAQVGVLLDDAMRAFAVGADLDD